MATTARFGGPYIWVTWITGLLATDDQCHWAPWFKAHFKFNKVERSDSALTKWKAEHGEMVNDVVRELTADGWQVFLEAQNKFTLHGKAATVGGVADIVAVRGTEVRVVDCKSGKPRDKDFWQVCLYLMILPLTHDACKAPARLVGEVRYRDHSLWIQPEEFTADIRAKIAEQIRETGGALPPRRVPSFRECQFCDISSTDCKDRIQKSTEMAVAHELF